MFYRRHLPHWIPPEAAIFLAWRLAGSPPPAIPDLILVKGEIRRKPDPEKHLRGPFWLQDTRIAAMLVQTLHYGKAVRRMYHLHAWVIMPNHIHVILEPYLELATITRWFKGRTSRIANRILGRTGKPFWQDESFDRWIRGAGELQKLIDYVETNPVKAGLVTTADQWPWSSPRFKTDGTKL